MAFQYNIIHHILPTKSIHFLARITESNAWTLCKTEKQIIQPFALLAKKSLFGGS